MTKSKSKKAPKNTVTVELSGAEVVKTIEPEIQQVVEEAVQEATKSFTDQFIVNQNRESTELLDVKCFNQDGVCLDPNHHLTLAKLEIWTDQPRFFIKRTVSGCFHNPWNFQVGGKDDIRYIDVYGRKAKWVEVSAQIFQLYERYILGEEADGKRTHNNLSYVQAEQLYKQSIV